MFPVHSPEHDEDDDKKPLVRPAHARVSEDENEKHLVQPELKTGLELVTPSRVREKKDLQFGKIRLPQWDMMDQETSESDLKKARFWSKTDGEALRHVINQFLDERNWRDLHLKHYHMSTSQFKKDICIGLSWNGL